MGSNPSTAYRMDIFHICGKIELFVCLKSPKTEEKEGGDSVLNGPNLKTGDSVKNCDFKDLDGLIKLNRQNGNYHHTVNVLCTEALE